MIEERKEEKNTIKDIPEYERCGFKT